MLQSAIYLGQVFHKRFAPVEHQLNYRAFYLLLDLDEASQMNSVSRWFGWNKRAWFAFREKDYGVVSANAYGGRTYSSPDSLKAQYTELLATRDIAATKWSFKILTIPRILGYAFNPISLVYCRDEREQTRAMIYEVNNTFGERVHYVLPANEENSRIRHACDKEMFVSPFFNMDGDYQFDVGYPQEQLNFKIDYHVNNELALRASFAGKKLSFSSSNLARLAVSHSHTAIKVIAGIHFEAIKLWWKGLPLVSHVPMVNRNQDLDVNPTDQTNGAGVRHVGPQTAIKYGAQSITTKLKKSTME
ncbi:MAG: DUF1365 domain-containing protein [Pseudomonadota bacterium]